MVTKNVTVGDNEQRENSVTAGNLAPYFFKPGQSGNPKGRGHTPDGFTAHLHRLLRKGYEPTEARRLAAEKSGIDLDRIESGATNAGAIAHVTLDLALRGDMAAIKEIADRTEGKPAQSVALTGGDGGPIGILSYDATQAMREKLLADLENRNIKTDKDDENG